MPDQENPTPPDVKVIICQQRLAGHTAAEIAERVGLPVLLVQEILRAAGWPSRTKTAGYAAQLSGGVKLSQGTRDDSVQALCALAQHCGTQRMRTLAERLTRTQAEILHESAEAQEKKRRREEAAKKRAAEEAIRSKKRALQAAKRKLKEKSGKLDREISDLNRQLSKESA